MRPQPLLQFTRVGLDPAEDGRVVDLHAPIRQHQFEIAVAHREHQAPSHCPQDHLAREVPSLEVRHPPYPLPVPGADHTTATLCRKLRHYVARATSELILYDSPCTFV